MQQRVYAAVAAVAIGTACREMPDKERRRKLKPGRSGLTRRPDSISCCSLTLFYLSQEQPGLGRTKRLLASQQSVAKLGRAVITDADHPRETVHGQPLPKVGDSEAGVLEERPLVSVRGDDPTCRGLDLAVPRTVNMLYPPLTFAGFLIG